MKILLLTPGDPSNHNAWSGTVYRVSEILKSLGHFVSWHGKLPRASIFLRIYILFIKIFTGDKYQWKLSIPHSKRVAKIINRRVDINCFDLIFVIAGAAEAAFVDIKKPIIYLSDATFSAMLNYAPGFSNLSDRSMLEGNFLEQQILDKTTHIIYSSDWAKNSAIKDYNIPESKISVLNFGPHLNKLPLKKDLIFDTDSSEVKLLFIGNNWKRKGGQVAVDALNELVIRGFKASLTIVGCSPNLKSDKNISIIPFLDKHNPKEFSQLCDLYLNSTFFILPTLNEAAGIVFSESAAFALPAISADTGGVPSYIIDKITGMLLSPKSNGVDYADTIDSILKTPDKYKEMRIAARESFEKTLNWDIWRDGCSEIIKNLR